MVLLDRIDPPTGRADELADGFDADLRSLVRAMRGAVERLESMEAELDWRRVQMLDAGRMADRKPLALLLGRTGLGKLVARWGQLEEQGEDQA